ncbi:MAG: transposase zinc-binding domain-containing protein [Chitinivibrionales bacterium]
MKCGDLKQGFARVRCPYCKEEFFVAFSCRQRPCCPSSVCREFQHG